MALEFSGYIITEQEVILDALTKIDKNKAGFLIVVNEINQVLGTLTDGDIRRAFLRGDTVKDSIKDIYNKKYQYLKNTQQITDAIGVFKNSAIKFLPILDEEHRLVNILTKQQMHSLLILDIHADLKYDFLGLDDTILEHEVFQRPWGYYKTSLMNDYFQSKLICINPGGKLSLQSHARREEHWIIAHGNGVVQIGESLINVTRGSSLFIPKGCKHRVTNVDEKESLIITEVQLGDYFGEDDIIRYEDIYGRVQ